MRHLQGFRISRLSNYEPKARELESLRAQPLILESGGLIAVTVVVSRAGLAVECLLVHQPAILPHSLDRTPALGSRTDGRRRLLQGVLLRTFEARRFGWRRARFSSPTAARERRIEGRIARNVRKTSISENFEGRISHIRSVISRFSRGTEPCRPRP